MEVMTTSEGSEVEENISLKIIMDKLNAMEARIEDKSTQMQRDLIKKCLISKPI